MTKNLFSSNIKKIAWLSTGAIFFILDRLLKSVVLNIEKSVEIFGDFLSFNFVRNYNIAFSLPVNGLLLNISIAFIVISLITYLSKAKAEERPPIFLIITGAISNLIDRLYYGYVIDYLDLQWFAIFNIADVLICLGTIMLGFSIFKKSRD